MIDELNAVLSVTRLIKQTQNTGIELQISDDFDRLRSASEEADRGPLTPVFDSRKTSIEEGFWLEGRSGDGRIYHMQAIRLFDLSDVTLWDHLHENRDLYCSVGLGIDPWKSQIGRFHALHSIRGRACYQGELWLPSRARGNGLGPILNRLLMVLALLRWQPDCIFAMPIPRTDNPSFAKAFNFAHQIPAAISWNDAKGRLVRHEGLIWSELHDLLVLVNKERAVDVPRQANEAGETLTVGQQ